MALDDALGTVTICKANGMFLRADAAGLLVRNVPGGPIRRIAWTEISRFADGRVTDGKGDVTGWQLVIVLRTGKQVGVASSRIGRPGEVVAAVRQVAQAHGVPADMAGVPVTKDGRPAVRGLYQDPGGRAGLRYWDGSMWSPLLPPEAADWSARTVRNWWAVLRHDGHWTIQKGPGSWAALPTAEGHWTYPATRALRCTVGFAVSAATSVALLAGGLVTVLWWDRGPHHGRTDSAWFWVLGGLAALFAFGMWMNRRWFRKLDELVKGAVGS
jgi:hypothetical protein